MAQFKSNMTFKGIKEEKEFPQGVPFEMTIKRAEEVEKNIQKDFPDFKLTRLDDKE
ncbi:hypothetical protein [Streptococcus uberis]|uniref:hypothetical protein n=1 Tax=Streptococcus uberis TaxID=1349 RepID=UPI0006220738|nr:hypothetical protein [Streptococcus uberis]KKF41015.1 hypothetical protein AF64_08750 [Streptococcus uberis C9359]KKF51870.1 hypothetical protein AF65_08810 [Streptococcus uberis C5388]QBX22071.1 hypothetical protein Javan633_0018 [Streptococcus phage Javan633]QBX31262.1 hypothetical protein Javan628_0018 [Streptococcus phage Javan628]